MTTPRRSHNGRTGGDGDGDGTMTGRGQATAAAFERAARKVIEDKGFLAATIADIAEEAGRSPGSFYNYYDSKEALLRSWATRFSDTASERSATAFDDSVDPQVALRAAVTAHWTTFSDHLAEMVGVSQMATLDDEFADHWRELRRRAIRGISAGIRSAQRDGYCPGVDPDLAASAIVAMLMQFSFTWLAQGGDDDRRLTADEAIDTLTTLWYRSVYWRP